MDREPGSKGEFPIKPRSLGSLPKDAKLVLGIRSAVKQYLMQHRIDGPIADLVAEQTLMDTDPEIKSLHDGINQPITFILPTPLLRFLALFTDSGTLY